MTIIVRAYANVSDVCIAWTTGRIDGCLGFGLQRQATGSTPVYLPTYMPFAAAAGAAPASAAPAAAAPSHHTSDQWPIQRYIWTDHEAVDLAAVQYRVVPITGTPAAPQPQLDQASEWSDPVVCGTGSTPGISTWHTVGIVCSPSIERQIAALPVTGTTPAAIHAAVKLAISTPGSTLRTELGGSALPALRDRLNAAITAQETVFAALYELNDPELLGLLGELGANCNLLLGNGSYDSANPDPNAGVVAPLQAKGVVVSRRLLTDEALAHNKFLVFCTAGAPTEVWSGSTNWTITGLCTESNNGILLQSPALAVAYHAYWTRLQAAGNAGSATIAAANETGSYDGPLSDPPTTPPPATDPPVAVPHVNAWLTALPAPANPASAVAADLVDLGPASQLILAAEQGAMFLMFEPGPEPKSLISPLATLAGQQGRFVHGVINQAPTGDSTGSTLQLFNRNARSDIDLNLIMPAPLRGGPVADDPTEITYDSIMIHSKLIVVDPFGANPVVMTGSHNMGQKASTVNDDNLLVITGAPGLAREYAVYIQGVFDSYMWRYARGADATAGTPDTWAGLAGDDSWQTPDYVAEGNRQSQFWLNA